MKILILVLYSTGRFYLGCIYIYKRFEDLGIFHEAILQLTIVQRGKQPYKDMYHSDNQF